MNTYEKIYEAAKNQPEQFWGAAARSVHWFKPPTQFLNTSDAPFNTWFPDGQINACYNALDLQVELGKGDQKALIYDSPVTGVKRNYTFAEALEEVSSIAGALKSLGVSKGDRVIIYLSLIHI